MAFTKSSETSSPLENSKQFSAEHYITQIEDINQYIDDFIKKTVSEINNIKTDPNLTDVEREKALDAYDIKALLNKAVGAYITENIHKNFPDFKVDEAVIMEKAAILTAPIITILGPKLKPIQENITQINNEPERISAVDAEKLEFNILGHTNQLKGKTEEILKNSENKAFTLAQSKYALDGQLLVENLKNELRDLWTANEYDDVKIKYYWTRVLKKALSSSCFLASFYTSSEALDSFLQMYDVNDFFGNHENIRLLTDFTIALGMSSVILKFKNRILHGIDEKLSFTKGTSEAFLASKKKFVLGLTVTALSVVTNWDGIVRYKYESTERQDQISKVNKKVDQALTTIKRQHQKLINVPSEINSIGSKIISKEEAGSATSKAKGKGPGWAAKSALFSGSTAPFNAIPNPNAKGLKEYLQRQGVLNGKSPSTRVQNLLDSSFKFEVEGKKATIDSGIKNIHNIQKNISPKLDPAKINQEYKKIITLIQGMDTTLGDDAQPINNEIKRLNTILAQVDTLNASSSFDPKLISNMEVDVTPIDTSAIQKELERTKVSIKSLTGIYDFLKVRYKDAHPEGSDKAAESSALMQVVLMLIAALLIDLGDTLYFIITGKRREIAIEDRAALASIDLAQRENQKYAIISKLHELLNSKEIHTLFPQAKHIDRDVVKAKLQDFIERKDAFLLRAADKIPEKERGIFESIKKFRDSIMKIPRKEELDILRSEKNATSTILTEEASMLAMIDSFLPGIKNLYRAENPSEISFEEYQKHYTNARKELDNEAREIMKSEKIEGKKTTHLKKIAPLKKKEEDKTLVAKLTDRLLNGSKKK